MAGAVDGLAPGSQVSRKSQRHERNYATAWLSVSNRRRIPGQHLAKPVEFERLHRHRRAIERRVDGFTAVAGGEEEGHCTALGFASHRIGRAVLHQNIQIAASGVEWPRSANASSLDFTGPMTS